MLFRSRLIAMFPYACVSFAIAGCSASQGEKQAAEFVAGNEVTADGERGEKVSGRLCTFQGEYGNIFAIHRLKFRWGFESEAGTHAIASFQYHAGGAVHT